jgi:hypothetical protein
LNHVGCAISEEGIGFQYVGGDATTLIYNVRASADLLWVYGGMSPQYSKSYDNKSMNVSAGFKLVE